MKYHAFSAISPLSTLLENADHTHHLDSKDSELANYKNVSNVLKMAIRPEPAKMDHVQVVNHPITMKFCAKIKEVDPTTQTAPRQEIDTEMVIRTGISPKMEITLKVEVGAEIRGLQIHTETEAK